MLCGQRCGNAGLALVEDGLPAAKVSEVVDASAAPVFVVHKVTEAGRVDDRQPQSHTVLLDVGGDGLDRDRLWSLDVRRQRLFARIQCGAAR